MQGLKLLHRDGLDMKNQSIAESFKILKITSISNYGRCKNLIANRALFAQPTALKTYPSIKLRVAIQVLECSFNITVFENRRESMVCEESIQEEKQKDSTGNSFHPHKLKIFRPGIHL
jgi:hypothetical protein